MADGRMDGLRDVLLGLAVDGRIAVAFSGGLDSRFLSHAALLCGVEPVLFHVMGPHMSGEESAYARNWAGGRDLALRLVEIDPLSLPEVSVNGKMRCYHCKHALFSRLKEAAGELPLCDGTHASDSKGYRPGMAALKELGIQSPLAMAGLDKAAIRQLAADTVMEDPGQRARPCMITRLSYGLKPDASLLRALERGEAAAEDVFRQQSLIRDGHTPDFRLRLVREGVMEMHVASDFTVDGLTSEQWSGLERALRRNVEEATAHPLSRVIILDSLSGYFDRNPL